MIPKFRAWDKQLKILRPVATIDFAAKEVSHWFDEDGETYCHFAECILMQSTGLKDKNGVEIFEGDIVEVSKDFLNIIDYRVDDGCWRLKPLKKQWACSYFSNYDDKSNWKITGNIYENPELLEV